MLSENYLINLARPLQLLILLFAVVLSIGYFSGIVFVNETTAATTQGVVENYNGNEDNEEADEMKFKKSSHEMLNIIHTHILSMSVIFFTLALLVYGTRCPAKVKNTLMIEPLISVLVTFGGIYLIWIGYDWMSYVVMISGALMSLSFGLSVLLISYTIIGSWQR